MKNQQKEKLYVVFFSILLASCNTLTYIEPMDGQRAKVRFAAQSTYFATLTTFSDENCSAGESEWMKLNLGSSLDRSPKKNLNIPLNTYADKSYKEVYLQANKQINGIFTSSGKNSYYTFQCGVPFSYAFLENINYEVLFRVKSMSCEVSIFQIEKIENAWVKVLKSSFKNIVNDKNSNCANKLPLLY